MKIVHVTSAHPRHDTRIWVKQCQSLAKAGHEVSLVVADGLGDDLGQHVKVLDVGRESGRLQRMLKSGWRVMQRARQQKADVYFLHDPELLPFALWLQGKGSKHRARVVFDSHEDVPVQILSKPYLAPWLRRGLAAVVRVFEAWVCRRLDGVLVPTPLILNKFLKINPNTVEICNYPLLSEFGEPAPWSGKRPEACYVGGIARIRGLLELVQAMATVGRDHPDRRLNIAGQLDGSELVQTMQADPGWAYVHALGFQDRQGVQATLARSMLGLVTLHPTPNYLESLPVKMFEYMAAGLPVIASDFPMWVGLVEQAQCGICVDPLSPDQIAQAIADLLNDPVKAEEMGARGRQAVLNQFNWSHQERKLLALVSPWAPPSSAPLLP